MNAILIALGVGSAAAVLALIALWRGRDRSSDLGFVSHQWLADRRLAQPRDPQR